MVDMFNIPEPQDDPLEQHVTPEPFFSRISAEVGSSLQNSVTGSLLNMGQQIALDHFGSGDFVAANKIPQTLKKEFPNGTNQTALNNAEKKQSNEVNRLDILSNAPQGKFQNLALDGVGLATNITSDFVGDATAFGLGKIGELGVSKLASHYALKIPQQTALRAIAGAGEGLGFAAIQNTASYEYQKQLGIDPNLDITQGAFLPALIGAGLHSLAGRTPGLSTRAQESAEKVAAGQAQNGDMVNANPVIKQGLYESINNKAQELGLSQPDLDTSDMQTSLKSMSDNLNDKIGQIEAKVKDIPDTMETQNTTINKLNNLWNKDKTDATNWSDKQLHEQMEMQNIPYFNDLYNATADNQLELTKQQQEHLDNLSSSRNYEQQLLKENMKSHADKINQLRQELSEEVSTINADNTTGTMLNKVEKLNLEDPDKVNNLNNKINRLGQLGKELNSMLKRNVELKQLKDVDNDLLTQAHQRGRLLLQRNRLQNLKDYIDGQFAHTTIEPTSLDETNAIYDQGKNGQRQAYVGAASDKHASQRISELETNMDLSYHRNRAKDLVDNKLMSKDSFDKVDKMNKDLDGWYSKLKTALPNTIKCLIKGAT